MIAGLVSVLILSLIALIGAMSGLAVIYGFLKNG